MIRVRTLRCFIESELFTCIIFLVSPNGLRYPRVGRTRERRFGGTNSKTQKLPENAARPTRRVHAVLGGFVQTNFMV